ncbi:hypothetical protein LV779_31910 [Streptomyces thinghirensis]|nr:hypothetical protein [Streptomyces thinghirensis]
MQDRHDQYSRQAGGPVLPGLHQGPHRAVIFCGDDVALSPPRRADSTHYTLPGGNVEDGEDFRPRELAEGFHPNIDQPTAAICCGSSTSASAARASTPSPRKSTWIYRFHITPGSPREALAEQELDELSDGSHKVGVVEWVDYRKTRRPAHLPTHRVSPPSQHWPTPLHRP